MDGIHDLGGKQGFGKIIREQQVSALEQTLLQEGLLVEAEISDRMLSMAKAPQDHHNENRSSF